MHTKVKINILFYSTRTKVPGENLSQVVLSNRNRNTKKVILKCCESKEAIAISLIEKSVG